MTQTPSEEAPASGSAQTLERMSDLLREDPENGLQTVLEAFDDQAQRALRAIEEQTPDFEALKSVRLAYTGEKSGLSAANRQMRSLSKEHKKEIGRVLGQTRGRITQALEARQAVLEAEHAERILVEEAVDVTAAPGRGGLGGRHPVNLIQERMTDVFIGMGWEVDEGPEVESAWFNFDALNVKPDHPARELQDTFYVDPLSSHLVLRTQTSPVQIRALLQRDLPLYVVSPGKVFRSDEYDATHLPVFHQLEGLVVDKGISMADLRGTLDHFARAMFGDVKTRMRPHHFPFTEPSAEVDLECFVCHGDSVGNPDAPCRTCRSEGWIEWGGCGVVNPRVLRACGIDADVYSGFAFGMGVDRTVMFRNNAPDLRDFVEGDIRFSRSLLGGAR